MNKRFVDLLGAILLLLICAPVLVGLAVLVRIALGRPILFRQLRPGLKGRPFELFKFRTMADRFGDTGYLLPDSDRLSRLGRWLRSTSLDELPELLNVIKGDMSLVGPRPLLMDYLPLYSADQARRHDVRPGITGWAQVNGRNGISWEEKFKLDVWYVDNWSTVLDLKILCVTLLTVVRAEGIEQSRGGLARFRGAPR